MVIAPSARDFKGANMVISRIEKGWCRSFPVRRLGCGEVAIGPWRRKEKECEWVARYSARGVNFARDFDRAVRRAVGKKALVFHCSTTMLFDENNLPVIYVSGHVVDRREAMTMGQSFNKEMRTGRRRWWR